MKSNLKFNMSQVSLAVLLAFTFNIQVANAEEEVLPEYTFMDAIKTGKNMTNFRLRYEHVEQDGLQPTNYTNAANTPNPTRNDELKDADGITLRSLVGWQTAPYKNFSFAVQFINVAKLDDNFHKN